MHCPFQSLNVLLLKGVVDVFLIPSVTVLHLLGMQLSSLLFMEIGSGYRIWESREGRRKEMAFILYIFYFYFPHTSTLIRSSHCSASPICTLETIHVPQMPILIFDAGCQVDLVLTLNTLLVIQLCMQHGLVIGAVPLEIDIGRIMNEVLGAPRKFACRISLVLASLPAFSVYAG